MLTEKIRLKRSKQHSLGFLRWSENSHIEQREIGDFISIGRGSDNLIVLEEDYISRRHCRIHRKEKEGFFLQDMDSKNGVFLNGNRVFKAILKNNDRIQLGEKELIFSFERFDNHWDIYTKSKNSNWRRQLESLPDIAGNNMPVLITGPSGTGKEMIAKLIHRYSPRSKGPMISINCSALSESLVESEFFGHVKGSYTGALTDRKGAFLAANGGSLFLDEIGDLPLHLQPKLLRALEYQEVKPVGADIIKKTDVRIIAATHQDLKTKVMTKTFRADLYFRLHVLNLSIPHLKDRMEDFDLLLEFFCQQYNTSFSNKAVHLLKKYSWPGNIRELKNTVARAKALFPKNGIEAKDIEQLLYVSSIPSKEEQPESDLQALHLPVLKKIEKELILKTLLACKGNQKKVAKELGMSPSTLYTKLKKLNLDPKGFKD